MEGGAGICNQDVSPGEFQPFKNITAWFSCSVNPSVVKLWIKRGGTLERECNANYLFSDDSFTMDTVRLYNWKQHFVVVKSSWILEVLRQRCPLADVDFKCHLLSPHLPALSMVEHTGASSVVQTSSIHPRDETMVGKDTSIALVGTSTKNHQSNAMTAVRTGIDEHTGISSVCFPDNHCGNMATSSTSFEQTSHFSSTSKAAAPVSQVQFLSSFLSEKRTGNKTASIALVGQIGLASGCNGPETNSVLMTSRTTPVKQMGLSSGNNLVTTTSSTIPVDLVGVVTSGNEIENSSVITTANTAPVNQPGRFFGNASENNNSNNTTTSIIAAGHDQVATIIPRNHSNAATTLMTSSTEIHGLSSAGAEATSSSSIQARYDSIWQKLEEERAATPFESVVHVDDVTISYSHLQLQLFDFVVSKPEFKVYKVQSPCRQ